MPWYVQVGADVVPAGQERTMSQYRLVWRDCGVLVPEVYESLQDAVERREQLVKNHLATRNEVRISEKLVSKRVPLFSCQECGKLFYTAKSAEKASYDGCPGCGGLDIDITVCGMGEVGCCVHGVYLGARCENCKPEYFGEEKDPLRPEVTTLVAGQVVGPNGKVVCPGVVCRCREGVKTCPMHGNQV